ncbi:hypothetical protein [Marinovum algicola]|uniref:hypothetical protein n=1 Tax=Marinovum algicola TaxID=42444 RepID=UPI0032ECB1EF
MTRDTDAQALDRLIEQEDVLQICYWYQGEGFGESFTPLAVLPFLKSGEGDVAKTFERLAEGGDLRRDGGAYVFTATGRRKAGRMFFETFTEFQQASHGECNAGCCDGDEPCDDPTHDHHNHAHG